MEIRQSCYLEITTLEIIYHCTTIDLESHQDNAVLQNLHVRYQESTRKLQLTVQGKRNILESTCLPACDDVVTTP